MMAGAGDRASDPKMVAGSDDGACDLKMVAGADDGAGDFNWRCRGSYLVSGTLLGTLGDKERLETLDLKPTRIHMFPHHLRGIGSAGGCYVEPSVVAIGPYHHDQPHLKQMEVVKQAVALRLCKNYGRSVQKVYEKILSIADDARRCYDASAIASLSGAEFAYMMFLDGCFLLWFMSGDYNRDRLLTGIAQSVGPSILKDVFLLENQVPWLVLKALMEFLPVGLYSSVVEVVAGSLIFPRHDPDPSWIVRLLMKCRRVPEDKTDTDDESSVSFGDSKPPHLLGLLRFILIHNMPSQMRKSVLNKHGNKSSLIISAVDMEQKGLKLAVSKAEWFPDMSVQKNLAFGELSLSPILLDDTTASWLANLAALEAAQAIAPESHSGDGYIVSSYLSVLAMLMDRVEDVRELRRSGVLRSRFSDKQTLTYFKGMAQHLRLGHNYYSTLGEIEDYMRRRPVRIAVHKFLYNNWRIIVVLLSIAGVLVGIFKALYPLRKT